MRRLILITGGQRSGKSTYAEQMALRLSPTPVYLATARIWDEEFRRRVQIHQGTGEDRNGPISKRTRNSAGISFREEPS